MLSRAGTRMLSIMLLPGMLLVASAVDAPQIVSVKKIWDVGDHNAFTDLIRFQDRFFCVFREAEDHVGGDGEIRVLASSDGEQWESAALIREAGIDLRDPKLSVTPDARLMIVAGGSVYNGTKTLQGRQPRVSFSGDGHRWSQPKRILAEGDWLWRVTWHNGIAYGVSYRAADKTASDAQWQVNLHSSSDGVSYELVSQLDVTGRPNETTLRFLPDGRMVALVRREAGDHTAWIGSSRAPYQEWQWASMGHRIGGPNFIRLPEGDLWAAGRSYPGERKTVLARLTLTDYQPKLTLPSGGDTSYPGLVWHDGLLWMSYYSSHEGQTSIYLAKIRLP